MFLVMLREGLDILNVHLSDDFPGTVESCDILVIALHGISIKLIVRFITCSLQRRDCLCHLSQELQGKTRCTVTLGMIRDWVLVRTEYTCECIVFQFDFSIIGYNLQSGSRTIHRKYINGYSIIHNSFQIFPHRANKLSVFQLPRNTLSNQSQ